MSLAAYYLRRIRAKTLPSHSRQTQIRHYVLNGEHFAIGDLKASDASDIVFKELRQDCYGLSKIDFQPGDVVIDIGGHVGFFSILLGRLYPQIKIYAFEPVKENHQHFQQNLERNQIHNVQLENLAVTHDGRQVEIYMHPKNTGGGLLSGLTQQQNFAAHSHYQVDSLSLDAIFERYGIERCHLLKIDCEGAEYEILQQTQMLERVDYLAGEFHSNQYLRSQGFTIPRLLTHIQQHIPAEKVFFSPCEMAQ